MVDSSVNRPVCKGMLEGVLCHIMSRPGITQQTLMEHFEAVLQPMAMLDLVQVNVNTPTYIGSHSYPYSDSEKGFTPLCSVVVRKHWYIRLSHIS